MAGPTADFWQEKFNKNEIAWDRGAASPQLLAWLITPEHRLFHQLWHATRDKWHKLPEDKREALRGIGWQPGPRDKERDARGDRKDRGPRPERDNNKSQPARFEAKPPRKEKPVDPDSPFAKLAALKEQLKK